MDDYGTRTWALMDLLEKFIEVCGAERPEGIAYESPFIPMGMAGGSSSGFNTTAQTIRLQIALASTVETVATKFGIPCLEVATQSAKTALIGFGRKPKDDPKWDWKKQMLLAATRQGYACADDHQADAIAVGKVAYSHWGYDAA